MKTINICLLTKDPEFGLALSRSLQRNSGAFSIEMVSPITNIPNEATKSLESMADLAHPGQLAFDNFDLVVTDDLTVSAERVVFLHEDPASSRIDEDSKLFVAYKYQHAGDLSTILRLAHSICSGTEMLSDETVQTTICSVCGSAGGVGCTSIALGICQDLVRYHGNKVLYITLEEFGSSAGFFPAVEEKSNNISRYLYSIFNHPDGEVRSTEGYIQKDEYGIASFLPARGRNPLRELNGHDFVKFINHVTKDKQYTNLVLDCGNGLDASIVAALQFSSYICLIRGKDTLRSREEAYLRTVANRAETNEGLVMIEVQNFYLEPERDDTFDEKNQEGEPLHIESDHTSFERINGRTFISLDKAFGQGIRELVRRLTGLSG